MRDREKIYLDYAATTPVDGRVLQTMLPFFDQAYGNPASIHQFGQEAEATIEQARETVARIMGCQPLEVVFTSCGSESDNLALRGVALAASRQRSANHILITPVEHHAVSRTALQLADLHGFEVEFIPVDDYGQVKPEDVASRLRPDTAIVSVIYANNEIGTINPIREIGQVCRARGIPFHSDAVQAAAFLPVKVDDLHVDLLSIGAHKFYGPKGVGALFIRQETPILPVQTGGSQEHGLRAGTSNTPFIAGLTEAFQLAVDERVKRIAALQPLRDHLINRILNKIPDSRLTGHPTKRLPNHASFVFEGADGNQLLAMLDVAGFACSSGSACKTGDPEPSDALLALGLPREWALGSLRVTLGAGTTEEHIEKFNQVLPGLVERVRKLTVS